MHQAGALERLPDAVLWRFMHKASDHMDILTTVGNKWPYKFRMSIAFDIYADLYHTLIRTLDAISM